ncbi:MAG TPA: hypothetical protein VJ836_00040 [Candidatus Saccharimonadales bacterium]|nr:hypothetical protein [Candidatus Saccharimonadales bacterium]
MDKTPGLGLPQPSTEQDTSLDGYQVGYRMPAEKGVASPEPPSMPLVTPSFDQSPSITPPPMQQSVDPATAAIPQQSIAAPADDDSDSDALDEEWVNKAKVIVEQTKNDPYKESNELGKVKADYLKIRYNKQIKVSKDA